MMTCMACGGTGRNSRGGECHPCRVRPILTDSRGAPFPELRRENYPAEADYLRARHEQNDQIAEVANRGFVEVFKQSMTEVVQHSSESVEWYTPDAIVEASRFTLGEIDLDPASCEMAQRTVRALVWYGPGSPDGEDGLEQPWGGRVLLNPPDGDAPQGSPTASNAALWWARLALAWQAGEVEQAIFVGFTLEILRSAQGLDVPQPLSFPLCVPSSRIDFDTVNRVVAKGKKKGHLIDPKSPAGARVRGGQPGHANAIVYLPPKIAHDGRESEWTCQDCGKDVWMGEAVERFAGAFRQIGEVRA